MIMSDIQLPQETIDAIKAWLAERDLPAVAIVEEGSDQPLVTVTR
jgi:hypothetical protein